MDGNETLRLMQAVLDGDATPGEREALYRALAADPAAQARFDEMRTLFESLDAMPPLELPAGFADAVVASVERAHPGRTKPDQLLAQAGVLGSTGQDDSVRPVPKPVNHARPWSGFFWGSTDMSKRGLWVVGGVAAAIVALFVGNVVDFPPRGDNAAGTIAPAKRYQAEQPGADELKLGRPTGGTTTATTQPVPAGTEALGKGSNEALGRGGSASEAQGRGGVTSEAQGRGGSTSEAMGRGGVTSEAQGRGGSTSEAMGRGGSTSEALGRGGATSEAMGRGGSTSEALGRGGATSEAQGRAGATSEAQGRGGSTSEAMNRSKSEAMSKAGAEAMNKAGAEAMNKAGSEAMNKAGAEALNKNSSEAMNKAIR